MITARWTSSSVSPHAAVGWLGPGLTRLGDAEILVDAGVKYIGRLGL